MLVVATGAAVAALVHVSRALTLSLMLIFDADLLVVAKAATHGLDSLTLALQHLLELAQILIR